MSEYPIAVAIGTPTLGSQDPINPVDVTHLHKKLSSPNSKLATNWKKTLLYSWAKRQDKECPAYAPSRRARTLLRRTRLAGDVCTDCARDRTNALTLIRSLRVDVETKFGACYGDTYGLTVGIKLDGHEELLWVDIVVMTLLFAQTGDVFVFRSIFLGNSSTLMKSPERIPFAPVYIASTQTIQVQRFGQVTVPKTANRGMGDMFDGRKA